MKQNKKFETKPKFIKEEEIVGEKPKEIVIFGSINSEVKPISNVTIKLPKTNPLSNMSKAFNKFDMIPQNMPTAPNVEKDSITKVEDSKDLNKKEKCCNIISYIGCFNYYSWNHFCCKKLQRQGEKYTTCK